GFSVPASRKRNRTKASERVAQRLGNTTAICRKCYIHPAIIDAYMDRSLVQTLKTRTETELCRSLPKLSGEEAAVLALLQQRMERELIPRANNHRKATRRKRAGAQRSRH